MVQAEPLASPHKDKVNCLTSASGYIEQQGRPRQRDLVVSWKEAPEEPCARGCSEMLLHCVQVSLVYSHNCSCPLGAELTEEHLSSKEVP